MEQNLSERERQIRLFIGVSSGILAAYLYSKGYDLGIVLALTALSVGFIINYFTCFCGAKKVMSSLLSR